jgi:NADH dehydrogenase
LFGKGQNPRNFVAVEDVATVAIAILADDRFKGRIVDVGGPENLTNMDVVHLYEQLAGRAAQVRHVPLGLLKIVGPLLRPFHPGLSQVMHYSICLDTLDCTFDAAPLLEEFPLELTRLEDWVKQRSGLNVQFA